MKKSLFPAILISCTLLFGCAAAFQPANPDAFGMNWAFLGVDLQKNQCFYAPQSLTHTGSITKYKFRGVDVNGYESTGWAEWDCDKNVVRAFDAGRYDKYYRLVLRYPDQPWQGVPTNSILYQNRSIFCK